jgi:tripartite-type tricarboxylate transporter receptor subunit TctC
VAKAAIDSGAVKALAVTGDVPSSALLRVPTFREAGVPDFELASWNVLLAPIGTPADVVATLKQEVALALRNNQVRGLLAAQGVEASTAANAFLMHARDKFGRVVRDIGITIGE